MSVAMALCRQTKNERKKHEADGLFLFRRKDENLAAHLRWSGRRPAVAGSADRYQPLSTSADSAARSPYQHEHAVRLHLGRRLTWSDRYFRRTFSS